TDPAIWSEKYLEDDPEVRTALTHLDDLKPGREDAGDYHETVFILLKFVFDWALENFEKEYKMDQGRGRIDIIADNHAGGGLFGDLRKDFNAWSVPMECKNYTSDLGNNEFNQITDRLGSKTSHFGMIFCREITDQDAMLKHCTDRWLRQHNVILLIDDRVLKELVNLRLVRDFDAIQARLRRMIRTVQYGGGASRS
ncbi:hypothetical protein L0152_28700, partial [bacterium]|nr:hypothetical protein [bacterium]